MANQEYPIFALERAASLIGNAMLPQVGRSNRGTRHPSTSTRVTMGVGNLLDRLDTWSWRQRQRADEAYLAQSQDVFDLERRIRTLERSAGSGFLV